MTNFWKGISKHEVDELVKLQKSVKKSDTVRQIPDEIRYAEPVEDMQFCEVCGGEWTDELPCLCELAGLQGIEDWDDLELEDSGLDDTEQEPDDSPLY